jgi:hypothetical protein
MLDIFTENKIKCVSTWKTKEPTGVQRSTGLLWVLKNLRVKISSPKGFQWERKPTNPRVEEAAVDMSFTTRVGMKNTRQT